MIIPSTPKYRRRVSSLLPATHAVLSIRRSHGIAHVLVVDQDHVGIPAVLAHAEVDLVADAHGIARGGVGRGRQNAVRDEKAEDVHVEEVIDDVHAAERARATWAIDLAFRELGICDIVGRLEVVVELGQQVRYYRFVCIIV